MAATTYDMPTRLPGTGQPPRRVWIERATLYGLAGSVLLHILIISIAAMVTVRFTFGDAGGASGGEGVEFAVLNDAELASTGGTVFTPERASVEASISESVIELDDLAAAGRDRSVDDLSESLAPALDPGGGGLTSLDSSAGSAGAGSGDGASFFGLEAKGRRFAYIVDVSGSMKATDDQGRSRWELTRAELVRSIAGLEGDSEFHVQLFASGSVSLFGVQAWSKSTPMNKRLGTDALRLVAPGGGTEPGDAFVAVFGLDPEPDAIYYMTDGEVGKGGEFAALVRRLNGRDRIPVHCILFGDAGSDDARVRVESLMKNIARQSGGRFTHIRGGRP